MPVKPKEMDVGFLNGYFACVCARWHVFVNFARFCVAVVRFCAFFLPKWSAEKPKFEENYAKALLCKTFPL